MPVQPPIPDPSRIELRLLAVAEMLDRAVAEVRQAMTEVKDGVADIEVRVTDIESGISKQQDAVVDHPQDPGRTNAD
jgi:hypothetical protein